MLLLLLRMRRMAWESVARWVVVSGVEGQRGKRVRSSGGAMNGRQTQAGRQAGKCKRGKREEARSRAWCPCVIGALNLPESCWMS
jgi:hypothetical protein